MIVMETTKTSNADPNPYKPHQKDEEENCKGLECLHSRDDNQITLPTVTPTFTVPSSEKTPPTDASNDGPNWGKVAAGVGIIVIVDLLVAIYLVIGLTALAPELEIAMILTEAWSCASHRGNCHCECLWLGLNSGRC